MYIFTDGSCQNNGKKNPRGGYAIFCPETNFEYAKNYTLEFENLVSIFPGINNEPTNNKTELLAILAALAYINQINSETKEFIICSDSNYSINCVTTWYKNWIKKGWVNSKNEPVKNKEIIKRIIEKKEILESKGVSIVFVHVNSHQKEPSDKNSLKYFLWHGNDKVDKLATQTLV